jgi:hypothetical protein
VAVYCRCAFATPVFAKKFLSNHGRLDLNWLPNCSTTALERVLKWTRCGQVPHFQSRLAEDDKLGGSGSMKRWQRRCTRRTRKRCTRSLDHGTDHLCLLPTGCTHIGVRHRVRRTFWLRDRAGTLYSMATAWWKCGGGPRSTRPATAAKAHQSCLRGALAGELARSASQVAPPAGTAASHH